MVWLVMRAITRRTHEPPEVATFATAAVAYAAIGLASCSIQKRCWIASSVLAARMNVPLVGGRGAAPTAGVPSDQPAH